MRRRRAQEADGCVSGVGEAVAGVVGVEAWGTVTGQWRAVKGSVGEELATLAAWEYCERRGAGSGPAEAAACVAQVCDEYV